MCQKDAQDSCREMQENPAVMKVQGSQMQDVTYRKVLQDDKGKQKVEVEQLAGWKFLMFSGSFTTRLYVYQDKQDRTVRETSDL